MTHSGEYDHTRRWSEMASEETSPELLCPAAVVRDLGVSRLVSTSAVQAMASLMAVAVVEGIPSEFGSLRGYPRYANATQPQHQSRVSKSGPLRKGGNGEKELVPARAPTGLP